MKTHKYTSVVVVTASVLICTVAARSQQSFYQQFRSRNGAMTEVQPTWIGPLIQSDARLTQGAKLSVSDATVAGEQVISYGNNHGFRLLGGRPFHFDFN